MSYHVLAHSIIKRASVPVAIAPLRIEAIDGLTREGLTPFTYSRFLVPHLMGFAPQPAIFLDADEVVLGDIKELFDLAGYQDNPLPSKAPKDPPAVFVAKNPVHQFEWASVILFNCWHVANRCLTPEYVNRTKQGLHKIGWLDVADIGDIPLEWNHLVGYDEPKPAKLVHFTQGIPFFDETRGCEYSDEWWEEYDEMIDCRSWHELMGKSVHATPVIRRLISEGRTPNIPGVV